MSSRDDILSALRKAPRYVPGDAPAARLEVVALAPDADLTAKFVAEAERHLASVYRVGSWGEAWERVSELLRTFAAKTVFAWDEDQFPAPGLQWALSGAGCERVRGTGVPPVSSDLTASHAAVPPVSSDAVVAPVPSEVAASDTGGTPVPQAGYSPDRAAAAGADAGITGVQAAIAATGSLVLESGPGRPRAASLLPPRHIALVGRSQILRSVEAWVGSGPALEKAANTTFITGPSRSADIEMIVTLGVHGPGEVYVVLVDDGE
jgi:L-lactate dehydrogenase complex protein LldG